MEKCDYGDKCQYGHGPGDKSKCGCGDNCDENHDGASDNDKSRSSDESSLVEDEEDMPVSANKKRMIVCH